MKRFALIVAVGVLTWAWSGSGAPAGEAAGEGATPAKEYQALSKEFQTAAAAFWQAMNAEETNKVVARVEKLPLQLLELVEKNPSEPFSLEALTQVVSQEYWLNAHTSHPGWGKDSRQARAIALILRDHLQSDKLGEACRRVRYGFRQERETFLRTVFEKSPHREIRGLACLALAQFLPSRIEKLDLLPDQPELTRRYELLYGKDYLEALRRQNRADVMSEAETLYEQALEKYGDVKLLYEGTVSETATRELYEIRHLSVGKEAPDIEGMDQDGQQFKLSDYRGKVVLLYFWSEF